MKILNELIAEGFVKESGYAPSSGGRRPVMYTIQPGTLYILSVAMDQLVTRISLMDIRNNHVVGIKKFELPLKNNPAALSTLAEKMEEVILKSGVDKKKIIGAGIGMPGFIDFKKGVNYTFLDSEDKTVTQYLSDYLGLPVYIDNDSSLIALAEFRFGAARHQKNAMVINIGWGIGLGMVLNGDLFRGHNGFAGEFSHIPLFNNNKLCACGKTGCLETEASLLVVIEKAVEGLKTGRLSGLGNNFPTGHFEQDWEAIVSAAIKGDQYVVELLSEAAYNIGKGLAILIHLINPESVILSGRGTLAGKVWQAPIQQALNEHCIPRLAVNTTVAISTLGYQAELIGSAALVMENQVKENVKTVSKGKKPLSIKR
ncbi:MAG: ROK family protein [Chitinophagaceae bacterium]